MNEIINSTAGAQFGAAILLACVVMAFLVWSAWNWWSARHWKQVAEWQKMEMDALQANRNEWENAYLQYTNQVQREVLVRSHRESPYQRDVLFGERPPPTPTTTEPQAPSPRAHATGDDATQSESARRDHAQETPHEAHHHSSGPEAFLGQGGASQANKFIRQEEFP